MVYYVEVSVQQYMLADSFSAIKKERGAGPNGSFSSADFNHKQEAIGFIEHILDLSYIQEVLLTKKR